jgi:hypothetical protein
MIDIKIKIKKHGENKEEKFLNFAAQQFKKLLKKNLRIPITLYHL